MADITELLNKWQAGDRGAFDELVPQVYGEMRAIAAHLLRGERPGHLRETSALVHEAYLRLVDQTRVNWSGRAHFFGAAANAMRRILVDQARRRLAGKRGAGAVRAGSGDHDRGRPTSTCWRSTTRSTAGVDANLARPSSSATSLG
jgi:RNA polymerase sigma factor (TIGR02999 family)